MRLSNIALDTNQHLVSCSRKVTLAKWPTTPPPLSNHSRLPLQTVSWTFSSASRADTLTLKRRRRTWAEQNGVTLTVMEDTITYWRHHYSWRDEEARLNRMAGLALFKE